MTRWAAVAGWPVDHSLSPRLHGAWLEAAGVKGRYDRLPAPEDGAKKVLKTALADPDCAGLNVTLPHKGLALRLADRKTDAAKSIGAANLLYRDDGKWVADNTDAEGFLYGLRRQASEFQPERAAALVLGAGGAARAAVYALTRAGARVSIANRTEKKARRLAKDFKAGVAAWPPDVREADLLVNATSIGLDGASAPPVDFSASRNALIVYDLVYRPLETPLLKTAKSSGRRSVDGLDMLIGQARPSFKAFFGVTPPDLDARQILLEAMERT